MDKNWVLLIEDNEDEINLAVAALKSAMVDDIKIARNGAEALDILLNKEAQTAGDLPRLPSMILLDLKMPKISGLEVLRRLRGTPAIRFVPLIVLTSSTEPQDLLQSYELGATSYIRKPIDYKHFKEVVRHICIYWLHINRMPSLEINLPCSSEPPLSRAWNFSS